jgi:hypothetical protein
MFKIILPISKRCAVKISCFMHNVLTFTELHMVHSDTCPSSSTNSLQFLRRSSTSLQTNKNPTYLTTHPRNYRAT